MVAKVERQAGELFPRVGFIVTNLAKHSKNVVRFYNTRRLFAAVLDRIARLAVPPPCVAAPSC